MKHIHTRKSSDGSKRVNDEKTKRSEDAKNNSRGEIKVREKRKSKDSNNYTSITRRQNRIRKFKRKERRGQ